MSSSLIPSKRPYERMPTESNGKGKWQKSAGFYSQNQPSKVSPVAATFRVLCPASKIGGIIGKGGGIISNIRQETGAKVRVEETVLGCDERIILITGSDKETEASNGLGKIEGDVTNVAEDKNDAKENGGDEEDNFKGVGLQTDKKSSCIQKALLLVFERMVEEETETRGVDEENSNSSAYVVRLLVLSNQVGCILGKAGSVIKQMSSESGAQIRILPRDKLPACASSSDELVQITGGLDAARKALQLVSQQLLENAPWDSDLFPSSSTGPSSYSLGQPHARPEVYPPPSFPHPGQGLHFSAGSRDGDYRSAVPSLPGRMKPPQEILSFRLLCPSDKVGSIIGKGGAIIKTVQIDTGCEIKVLEGPADSEDRIIIISGPVHPDDRVSAAQDALMRIQSRIVKASPESTEKNVMARLLVSSNQIGCLLGKGGAIITEMRKLTGAHIRILGKEQMPTSASEDDEVVLINGEFGAVQEALLQITSRLRHHFFRDMFPSMNHPPNAAFSDQGPPFPAYMGRRELSPPGPFSNLGPSFHKFDGGGLPKHGGFRARDDRPPFMHNIHRPVIFPHISERKPSSLPWGPQVQGPTDVGGSMGLPDYTGVPHRRMAGFGGGQQAIITHTTVDVVVPRSLVPVIYGEDGDSLKQICQFSDAKITITEPKPGATETVIIISGTPEETHAAQSLIQAFVMCGTETP